MQETTLLLGLGPHFLGPIQLNPLQQTDGCLSWEDRSRFPRFVMQQQIRAVRSPCFSEGRRCPFRLMMMLWPHELSLVLPKAVTSCLAAGGVGSGRCGAAQCLCLDNPRWLCTEPHSHGKQHKCCLKALTGAQQLLALGFLSILPAMDGQQWSWKGQERLYLYSPLLQGKREEAESAFWGGREALGMQVPLEPRAVGGQGVPVPVPGAYFRRSFPRHR